MWVWLLTAENDREPRRVAQVLFFYHVHVQWDTKLHIPDPAGKPRRDNWKSRTEVGLLVDVQLRFRHVPNALRQLHRMGAVEFSADDHVTALPFLRRIVFGILNVMIIAAHRTLHVSMQC